MNYIPLFLPDFRRIVDERKFKTGSEINLHLVTYFDAGEIIYFHKPIGSFLYYLVLDKSQLPEGVEIRDLISEFNATEIPEKIIKKLTINITANES